MAKGESTYRVLARKWRPQTFEEVVGQEGTVQTLKNAIKMGRIAHAYVFSGPRGIGKTTIARLLSKALNCEEAFGPDSGGARDGKASEQHGGTVVCKRQGSQQN